ncbi:MAG: dipeptidase [Candidatus Hydrogenedens sp.]|nr:dipeptidase [Candidatus Hydrogenedens sp.]
MSESAIQYARDRQDAFLDQFKQFLAMPSISTLSEHRQDVLDTAEWIASQLRQAGIDGVQLIPTAGFPVVYGESLKAPGAPTVLVYGHYDVQPADPLDEWDTAPFEPTIREEYLYARGASDMKGQLFAQLKAIEALAAQGDLPVNVKFMFEGEEEIGSPSLEAFIDQERDRIACDVVLNCDSMIHSKDLPSITYGLRGLAYFEVTLRTAAKDLHSGRFGGSVRNPIHELAALIAGLHDAEGRVTLPGFYDKVRALTPDEREALAKVPRKDDAWLAMAGAKALYGENGYTTVERTGARPALDLNGIWGGFTGEGAKTVLPAKAHAKLSARLVADQDPKDVLGQLRAYFEANAAEGVQWELHQHSAGPGAIMDRYSPYMKSATSALATVWGVEPIFTREGGSVPVVGMMQQMLGVDSIMLGFAMPDDGIHGPNERQYLPNTWRGIETYIRFYENLAGQSRG